MRSGMKAFNTTPDARARSATMAATGGGGELENRAHEPPAPCVSHQAGGVPLAEPAQARAQVGARIRDLGTGRRAVLEGIETRAPRAPRRRRRGCHRMCSVVARLQQGGGATEADAGADRQPAGQTLGEGEHVGDDPGPAGRTSAGTAERSAPRRGRAGRPSRRRSRGRPEVAGGWRARPRPRPASARGRPRRSAR